jgi:hypothetical protein
MSRGAYFVGHHTESRSRLVGARRFHRRVSSQDIGIERDFVDAL